MAWEFMGVQTRIFGLFFIGALVGYAPVGIAKKSHCYKYLKVIIHSPQSPQKTPAVHSYHRARMSYIHSRYGVPLGQRDFSFPNILSEFLRQEEIFLRNVWENPDLPKGSAPLPKISWLDYVSYVFRGPPDKTTVLRALSQNGVKFQLARTSRSVADLVRLFLWEFEVLSAHFYAHLAPHQADWVFRKPRFQNSALRIPHSLTESVLEISTEFLRLKKILMALNPLPADENLKRWATKNPELYELRKKAIQGEPWTFYEVKFLKEHKLWDEYQSRREYFSQRPYIAKIHRGFEKAFKWAAWASLGGVGILGYQMLGSESLTAVEFLETPLRDDQVQLVFTPTPVPHVAIRIKDVVYNYGRDGMTVSPVENHILERPLQRRVQRAKNSESSDQDPSFWFSDSKQFVTLNLDNTRVQKLKNYLEPHAYQDWANWPLVHDCMTLTSEALKTVGVEIPWLVDSSPSQVLMGMALIKSGQDFFGGFLEQDPTLWSIDSMGQVLIEDSHSETTHTLRNLYFNALESKFMIWSFAYSKLFAGSVFELTVGENERVYWDFEKKLAFDNYIKSFSEIELQTENSELFIELLMWQNLKSQASPQIRDQYSLLPSKVKKLLEEKKLKLNNPDLDFIQKQSLLHVIEFLEENLKNLEAK